VHGGGCDFRLLEVHAALPGSFSPDDKRLYAVASDRRGRLSCLAERHLVVIGGNAVNLLTGSQPVFHDRLALLALPVAGLCARALDVGDLFLDTLLNPIGTAVGGFIAQLADEDGQVALATHGFTQ